MYKDPLTITVCLALIVLIFIVRHLERQCKPAKAFKDIGDDCYREYFERERPAP